jgi:hypothetical protein
VFRSKLDFFLKVLLLIYEACFGIDYMLRYIAKTQPKGLKPSRNSSRPSAIGVASGVRRAGSGEAGGLSIFNAQHFLNLFPNVVKIACK